jgi:P2 family phage contractile tail tube protein
MGVQVNKIFHSNVYIDGTNSQIGRASETQLPSIAAVTSEHKGLGMFGTLELPAGLQALVVSVKWAGFYADLKRFGANPFMARRLQWRASLETYDQNGRVAEVPVVFTAAGSWKSSGGGTFKPQEASEFDDELTCTYCKLEVDGEEIYEIDLINNVYRVDGEDLLATMRANLGE